MNSQTITPENPTLKIIGLGGAGQKVLNHLLATGAIPGAETAALNTDAAGLAGCTASERLVLGAAHTRGLSCGGDVGLGRTAAESDAAVLRAVCSGTRLVFLIAGLGGGCGTGAAPVLARMARESGSLVLAIVTTPFEFEGSLRKFNAEQGLKELRSAADAVIVLPNQRLRSLLDDRTTATDTFAHATELLAQCASGIWRLLTRPGLLALDFANLEKFVRGRHVESAFATVETTGESRALNAVDQLVKSPFLDRGRALTEADGILLSLAAGPELTINEIDRVSKELGKHCRDHTHWVVGTSIDESLAGKLQLTIIATRQNAPNGTIDSKETSRHDSNQGLAAEPQNHRAESITGLGGELSRDSNEPRPSTGHTAPPPELSPQLRQAVLGRQTRGRRRKRSDEQPELGLFVVSRSRFADTQETVHNKQNLDEPTYLRRGMALN